MAIKKEITFEGLTYTLNDQARVGAFSAVDAITKNGKTNGIASGSVGVSAAASGQLFITSSTELKRDDAVDTAYHIVCMKA